MKRAAGLVSALLVVSALAACGAPNPYCVAVEKGQTTLDSFGSKRTDAAFASYSKTMKDIASVAPANTKKQWDELTAVTDGVIAAHAKVGIKLEDMGDEKAREKLGEADITLLNKAYATFNDTQAARTAVVDDVAETCDIQLK